MIGSIGNTGSNNGMLMQSTGGQPAINGTHSLHNGLTIRQGFHQSYAQQLDGIEHLTIILFPNPSGGIFQFEIEQESDVQFKYSITDTKGSLIESGVAYGNEKVQVNMSNSANGIYYLKIVSSAGSGFFKISKTL